MPTGNPSPREMTVKTIRLEERKKCLSRVPLFSALSEPVLEEIADKLGEEYFPEGTAVFAEGEKANRLYLIARGKAEVFTQGPDGPVLLASLTEGEMFGELALLSPMAQRQATVRALTSLLTLTLDARTFEQVLFVHPEIKASLSQNGETLSVAKFLKQATPFVRLDAERIRLLSQRLEHLSAPAGHVLLRQGELGDSCFLLRSGRVEVAVKEADATERHLATLGPGSLFGETALLTEEPRNATVKALEPCTLLRLRRSDLLDVIKDDLQLTSDMIELMNLRDRPCRAPGIMAQTAPTADKQSMVVLKDPQRGAYFSLSEHGWFIWQRLDGRHNLRDLAVDYLMAFNSFSPQVVAETVRALVAAGFARGSKVRPDVLKESGRFSLWRRLLGKAKQIMEWSFSIEKIDPLVTRLHQAGVRWAYTRPGQIVLAVVALFGVTAFLLNGGGAIREGFQRTENHLALILLLLPAWFLATLVHEAGHAFTAKAFGHEVPRAGVGWYWFTPMAFVDTSDMWLDKRWPRIVVSIAGVYSELVLAGFVAMAACFIPSDAASATLWIFALGLYASCWLTFKSELFND